MTRVYSSAQINKPIETVFDYATTAKNWPSWHTASESVSGAVDHSADVGEVIIENIIIGGPRDTFRWVVKERRSPDRWVFEGKGKRGAVSKITYTLSERDGGTFFEREMLYTMPWYLRLLDKILIRKKMAEISDESVMGLKKALEEI